MKDFIKHFLMDSEESFSDKRGVWSYTAYKHYKKTFDPDLTPIGVLVLIFFVCGLLTLL